MTLRSSSRTRRISWPIVSATLAAVAFLLACDDASRPRTPPNIVLISIDSLRASHVGAYGYARNSTPFIDRLASQGARFADAVSTSSWTLPAHAALFTGRFDSAHGLVDNGLQLSESLVTLPELLRSNGYRTAGFYAGPYLHPTFGFDQGFDVYQSCMTALPQGSEASAVRLEASSLRGLSHGDVTGPQTIDRVERWLGEGVPTPFFLFVHLWDPHYDYIPPPEFSKLFDPDYEGEIDGRNFTQDPRIYFGMNERDLAHLVALYDGEIRFTDQIVEQLLAGLEIRGLMSNTLVVVTADHGEEFFEHGGKGHQRTLFEEVLRVPLILWWPGEVQAGIVIEDQVSLVDLYPTLARMAGVMQVPLVQGEDLSALLSGNRLPERSVLAELLVNGQTLRAVRRSRVKFLKVSAQAPSVLYRLDRDPGELQPITSAIDEQPWQQVLSNDLERLLRTSRTMRLPLGRLDADRPSLDRELEQRLRALGYLGDASDRAPAEDQP